MAFGGFSKDFSSAEIYNECTPAEESVDIKNEELMQYEQNPCSSKMDDFKSNSDSISSGSSMSDSDVTSTDSEDSLALSESESITDVTPLNSPYCDSPLHQSKIQDPKYEDKLGCAMKNLDISPPKETNVLMKAIERLEVESNLKGHLSVNRGVARKKKAVSFTGDDMKRVEQENQRLFKRVISQQNRIKVVPTSQTGHKNLSITRHQELRKSDGDISVIPKKSQTQKEESRSHIRRQQKCLSHPSSYPYTCGNKMLLGANAMNKGTSKKLQDIPAEAIVPPTASVVHDCMISNISDMQE